MQNSKKKKNFKSWIVGKWTVFFIAIVWFIFSSPFFIQHKVPYPSKYQVNFFTPWSEISQYAGPVKNNAMPDVVDEIYPWRHFTIEQLKKGTIPLWNPYSFSGTPHLADYQSAVFSPFNLIFFIFSFVDAWSLLVLLQPLVAGLCMYLFLKELNISNTGSAIGSISFMFCGFITVWMAYGTLSMAIALLPLCLFAVEKCFQEKKLAVFLLPIGMLTSFFSGHFQTSLYLSLYVFFYILFKYISTKNIKALVWACLLFFLGIVISLAQIVPSLEFYKLSVRSEIFSNSGGIPFQYLVTIFAPDFFGSPITRNNWYGYYAEWASFIGIVPLFLASFGVSAVKKSKHVLFFIFGSIISLLLSLDTPLQNIIAIFRIPIFSTSIPSRMIVIFSFSVIVLSGFGFDSFITSLKERELKKILLCFIPIGALVILAWFVLAFRILPSDKTVLALRNLLLPSAFLCVILGLIFVSFLFPRNKIVFLAGITLLFLTSFDSLRFATKWMPFDSKDFVFPQVPVIEAIQKRVGYGRVYGDFGAYIDTYYDIPSIEGYDPLYNKRYGEFIESSRTGTYTKAQKSVVSLPKRGKYADRVLDLLGVNAVYNPVSRTDQSWAFPVWNNPKKYQVVYQDKKFQLFSNKEALPRVKLFHQYQIIKSDKDAIERFYADKFDFRNVLILDHNPGFESNSDIKNENDEAKIISYSPNEIKIDVSTKLPSFLFLSDSYYPLWKAKVNGKNTEIYQADYAFRAVVVPQGKSEVRFYIDSLF